MREVRLVIYELQTGMVNNQIREVGLLIYELQTGIIYYQIREVRLMIWISNWNNLLSDKGSQVNDMNYKLE
jgi:hypothetical protein